MPVLEKPESNKSLTFDEMLIAINKQFSRCDNKVDTDEIWRILESYQSNSQDWSKFAFYDEHRYKRNLVMDHEKFNVMILCWPPNVTSSIHDHSGSHCFMKVSWHLDGITQLSISAQNTRLTIINCDRCLKIAWQNRVLHGRTIRTTWFWQEQDIMLIAIVMSRIKSMAILICSWYPNQI